MRVFITLYDKNLEFRLEEGKHSGGEPYHGRMPQEVIDNTVQRLRQMYGDVQAEIRNEMTPMVSVPAGHYRVQWEIDIEAATPKEAAEQAFEIMKDPESIATVFDVFDSTGKKTTVDMLKLGRE